MRGIRQFPRRMCQSPLRKGIGIVGIDNRNSRWIALDERHERRNIQTG